jgi:hypothetical protein
MNMHNYQNFFKPWWLGLALVLIGLVWSTNAQASFCLPPTPINAIINPFTGKIDLHWINGSPAKTFTLKILKQGKLCTDSPSEAGEKEITDIPGNISSYTINGNDLDCGKWLYCLQATCCTDSCETCMEQGLVVPTQDYCAQMKSLEANRCACPTPEYPILRRDIISVDPYVYVSSFRYKCADIANNVRESITPCDPLIERTVGCFWGCTQVTNANTKWCGTDYSVKCGSVDKRLVNTTPFNNLCSVDDGRFGYIDQGRADAYLKLPPGVVPNALPSPLVYDWSCIGGTDACLACRRAECNPDYNDQLFKNLVSDDVLCFAPEVPSGALSNTPTGIVEGFTFDLLTNKWTWKCVGRKDCDKPGDPPNEVSCQALQAGCGTANNNFYVLANFQSLGSFDRNFLCLNGGSVESLIAGQVNAPGWLDDYHYRDKDALTGIVTDKMAWKCTYPATPRNPQGESIECKANIIDCKEDTQGKNLTKDNFDTNYSSSADKLCQNGFDDSFVPAQGTFSLTPPDLKWTCSDNYGGSIDCSANLVDCKAPPHKGYYLNFSAMPNSGCTAGTMSAVWAWPDTPPIHWLWDCQDADGYLVPGSPPGSPSSCYADQLACAKPPSGKSYKDSAELIAAIEALGGSCNNTSYDNDETTGNFTCTGVCNDKTKEATATLNDGLWTWSCGELDCKAYILNCAKPPANDEVKKIYQYFSDLNEFQSYVRGLKGDCEGVPNVDGDPIDNQKLCFGICTDPEEKVVVTFANGKFSWICGKKNCEAFGAGCGPMGLGQQKISASSFKAEQAKSASTELCLNGGTPVWFNTKGYFSGANEAMTNYGKPEPGFTPYGNGEYSSQASIYWSNYNDIHTPFLDFQYASVYKEGTWAWQCQYPGKTKLYPTSGGYSMSDNSVIQTEYFCNAEEAPECHDLPADTYTLNELIAASNATNQMGNAYDSAGNKKTGLYLCDRGILPYSSATGGPFGEIQDADTSGGTGLDIVSPSTIYMNKDFGKLPWNTDSSKTPYTNPANLAGNYIYRCQSHVENAGGPVCAVDVKGCANPPDGAKYSSDLNFKTAYTLGACEGGLTPTGQNFSPANGQITGGGCIWSWDCGGDICAATKEKAVTTIGAITGLAKYCSDVLPETYEVAVNDCDNPTVVWTLTKDDGSAGPWTPTNSWTKPKASTVLNLDMDGDGTDDLTSGTYTLSVSVTCTDGCGITETAQTASKGIEIITKPTVTTGTITAEPNPTCSEDNTLLTLTGASCSDGSTPTLIQWFDGNNTELSRGNATTHIVNETVTTETTFDYYAKVTCGDSPCNSTSSTPTIQVTVDPAKTWTASNVAGPDQFCSGLSKTYSTTIGNCTTPTVTWTLTGPVNDSVTGTSYTTPTSPTLPEGDYTLSFTATCADPCATPDSITKSTTFKIDLSTTLAAANPSDDEFCASADDGALPDKSYGTTITGCDSPYGATTVWTLRRGANTVDTETDAGSLSPSYTLADTLASGDYTLTGSITCTNPCALPTTVTVSNAIKINPAKTWTASNVAGPDQFCSGLSKTYSTTIGNCTTPTVTWTLTGPVNDSVTGTSYTTPTSPTLPEGDYTLSFTATCADPCATPDSITKSTTFTIDPTYETPNSTVSGPTESCYGSDVTLATNPTFSTTNDPCPVASRHYAWYVDGSLNTAKSGTGSSFANFDSSSLSTTTPPATHSIYVKITCEETCVDPDETTSPTHEIAIYDCTCGTADSKNFVGGTGNTLTNVTDTGSFRFCKAGCTAVPTGALSLSGDGWNWQCECGGLDPVGDCSAKQAKCGTASSERNASERYYTDTSWATTTKGTICTNSSSNPSSPTASDDSNTDEPDGNSCNGGGNGTGIKDIWKWNCVDSVGGTGHQLDCSAKRLDCGVASAERVIDNGGSCKVQPYDATDGYRGSYNKDSGVTESHRCNWGDSTGYDDTDRGKWWWECVDSLDVAVQCEARKDCGWASRTDTVGTQRFTTVDYGSNGCWTAEDVGRWGANGTKDMVWGRANRFAFGTGDTNAYTGAPQWSACKVAQCLTQLNNTALAQIGVCPTNFILPTDAQWHSLENVLSTDNCTRTDSRTVIDTDFKCGPAGNDGDTLPDNPDNDGLKDLVTFAGVSGRGYWTRTPKNAGAYPNVWCTSAGNCPKTLPYYQLNTTDNVGRNADPNSTNYSCTGDNCLKNYVRCRMPATGGGIIGGGGGGERICYGFGC